LSTSDLETMPDDIDDGAKWNEDDPNRNIKHVEAERSVAT
jgi:hypothetical protein